ncbi:MAG: hypothetical protein K2X27_06185 [Candidatus Obscuribacterales bacterium]|nr:hypothetical protein [Candidatus Obscuribacterales bacterium]
MAGHSFESFSAPSHASSDASSAFHADYFNSTVGKILAPETDASAFARPAAISEAGWSQVSQMVEQGHAVNFTVQGAGQVPDYILGSDGTLTRNPAKPSPSADGSVTIQVENANLESAKKAAVELQTAVVNQKIAYWQKANPGKDIPGFLKGELAAAQNLGSSFQPKQAPERAPQAQPDLPPQSPGGGYDIGGRNIGNAPSGGFRPGNFEPNGPIDRSAIPKPIEGDLNIKGPPSCNPEQIQTFLEKMGSPAAREQGFSQALYDACTQRGIDPAVAVGFFLQESTCGRYGRGHENHSMGNIKGVAPESGGTDGTFRSYGSWAEGARDWARLIDEAYVQKRGMETLSQVISVYAPSSDGNNERGYVSTVKGVVENFKKQNGSALA